MKNLYYILLLLAGTINAQNIVFDGTVFKDKLFQAGIAKDQFGNNILIDVNGDSEISYAEAALVYELKLQNENIPNLTGIEHFINLNDLRLKGNQFTTIDVSTMTHLTNLEIKDNSFLTSIYSKNGSVETIDYDTTTPNLVYICADENQVLSFADSNGSALPNYIVNSYCTVTPGGNYNTVTGQIVYDNDNNTGTTNFANAYLKLINTTNGNTIQTVSKANGNYNFYTTQSGNYNVIPGIENPTWFTFTPTNGTFTNTNNNINTNNYFVVPNGVHQDVEISIRPVKEPVGGLLMTTVPYEIVFKNKGTQPHSGSLTMNFNNLLLLYQSSTFPVNLGLGSITHNYSNLLPFETRSFVVTLSTINLLTVGSTLQSSITIDSAGETTPTQNDNNFTYNQKVVGANNPNKVECLEGDSVPDSQIGQYLHYAINFENTGNQTAKNVTIKTVLDDTKYDMNTIQILRTTHPLDLEVINNRAYFKFRNAEVGGPGGQGGILLKIATNPTMPSGSTVTYGAEIFFDYDANANPNTINTNNANTTFGTLKKSVFNENNSLIVYPNPSSSEVFISSKENELIRTVELYDTFGRLLQTNIPNVEKATLDISQRAIGIYFLKITTDNGQKVEQIMKK